MKPTASDWSEAELMRRVLELDRRAWLELVRRYRSVIHRCILKTLARGGATPAPADVEEIYAELLMSLWRDDMRKLRAWDPARGARLGTWLGLLAKNEAYDHARSGAARHRAEPLDEVAELEHPEASPLDVVLADERRARLSETLAAYPERDRRFLALYFGRKLSIEELASELSMSVNTVYTRKHKLLNRLAAHMAAA